jgi:hypothetical protein
MLQYLAQATVWLDPRITQTQATIKTGPIKKDAPNRLNQLRHCLGALTVKPWLRCWKCFERKLQMQQFLIAAFEKTGPQALRLGNQGQNDRGHIKSDSRPNCRPVNDRHR